MHLSPASQSLLKTHQTNIGRENRLISKLNIKMEPNTSLTNNVQGFNLPPTPPSSLPSDDSEDNQSPEHSSPMSPPITTQTAHNSSSSSSGSSSSSSSSTSSSSSGGSSTTTAASSTGTGSTTRRSAAAAANQTSSSGFGSGGGGGGGGSNRDGQGRLYSTTTAGPTTRQPIHTPLISNQPVMKICSQLNCIKKINNLIDVDINSAFAYSSYRRALLACYSWLRKKRGRSSLKDTLFRLDYHWRRPRKSP